MLFSFERRWVGRFVWIALAGAFAVLIYFFGHTITGNFQRKNSELTLEFLTGYVIEESLSVDNLFVFLVIFRFFAVPRRLQHGVLSGAWWAHWSCGPCSSWWESSC